MERLLRLQNQKKIWFEKMIYIVQRGLSDVEKLKKIKAEETVRIDILKPEIPLVYSSSNIGEPLVSIVDWSIIPPISLFSFGLFTDFKILDIVEIFSNIQL